MKKSNLGLLLSIFFGLFGLLGLLACSTQEEKDEFMSGWWKGFLISIILTIVLVSFACCSYMSLINYYG